MEQIGIDRRGRGFYLHNIGPGFALNVSHVSLPEPGTWDTFKELGAIASGGSSRLTELIERPLRDLPTPENANAKKALAAVNNP